MRTRLYIFPRLRRVNKEVKMAKRQRNYTASERALITLGIASGATLDEINEVLKKDAKRSGATFRPFHKTSYDMSTRYPLPQDRKEHMRKVWDHVLHPQTLGDHARQRAGSEPTP
jgi:hypothetical protein